MSVGRCLQLVRQEVVADLSPPAVVTSDRAPPAGKVPQRVRRETALGRIEVDVRHSLVKRRTTFSAASLMRIMMTGGRLARESFGNRVNSPSQRALSMPRRVRPQPMWVRFGLHAVEVLVVLSIPRTWCQARAKAARRLCRRRRDGGSL